MNQLKRPADYLAELVARTQITLIGDVAGVAAHLEFLAEAVPTLAANGVTNLGWDYTNSRRQAELDALVGGAPSGGAPNAEPAGGQWSDQACADLFADLLGIGFAYQQYADVLRAVYEHNAQVASRGHPPLRMLALGLTSYVEDPDLLEGRSAGELELRNWWLGGHYRDVCAFHAANLLTTEVLRRGERAVVYTDLAHTTTRLVSFADGLATTTLGNLLHHWMGNGVRRVLFHAALEDPALTQRVEELVAASPESARDGADISFGLDLANSTLGNVGLAQLTGVLNPKTEALRLADVADGYLYLRPRAGFEPVTLLEPLITEANFAEVEARYRALVPRSEPYSRAELEQVRAEGLEQLLKAWPSQFQPKEEKPRRRFGRR